MVKLIAFQEFNFFEKNLFFYTANYSNSYFQKNANITYDGATYSDYYWTDGYDNFIDFRLDFLGSGFTINPQGEFTGGTVNAVAEVDVAASQILWIASGASISAVSIYRAALTPSSSDEVQLYQEALSGDDDIRLSPFNDRISGYGGNDRLFGGGGNDVLDGGAGSDTAVFLRPIENYEITLQGNIVVVSSASEGTDQLTGFETFEFGGIARSFQSLSDTVRPSVVSLSPPDGASDVQLSSDITLIFSEAIRLGMGNVFLRESSASGRIIESFNVSTSARLEVNGSTLKINPTADLSAGTRYFVSIDAGSVTDLAGNAMSALNDYDFTTFTPNRAPVASAEIVAALEDGAGIVGQIEATDPDGDALAFEVVVTGQFAPAIAGLSIKADGSYSFNPSLVEYQGLKEGEVIHLNAGYLVSDGSLTASSTLTISIRGVNDAPRFVSSAMELTTSPNASASFSASAVDVDGDTLKFAALDPAHGTVTAGLTGAYTYTPDRGFVGTDSIRVSVSDGKGGTDFLDYSVIVNPPPSGEWRHIASTGFVGEIGGSGQILGTGQFQEITVLDLPGSIIFDPSFNRTGDIVRFDGDADAWRVMQSGSSAVFTDGDTFVRIPVGTTGLAIAFKDGVRELRFDAAAGSLKIGDQNFAGELVQITSHADETTLPVGADAAAAGRLLLSPGAVVTVSGRIDVLGTSNTETLTLLSGSVTLDPSFNRGGDRLVIDAPATRFSANRSGSTVFLDSPELDLVIPFGTPGMTLEFAGGDERVLRFDALASDVFLGEQPIMIDPVALGAS